VAGDRKASARNAPDDAPLPRRASSAPKERCFATAGHPETASSRRRGHRGRLKTAPPWWEGEKHGGRKKTSVSSVPSVVNPPASRAPPHRPPRSGGLQPPGIPRPHQAGAGTGSGGVLRAYLVQVQRLHAGKRSPSRPNLIENQALAPNSGRPEMIFGGPEMKIPHPKMKIPHQKMIFGCQKMFFGHTKMIPGRPRMKIRCPKMIFGYTKMIFGWPEENRRPRKIAPPRQSIAESPQTRRVPETAPERAWWPWWFEAHQDSGPFSGVTRDFPMCPCLFSDQTGYDRRECEWAGRFTAKRGRGRFSKERRFSTADGGQAKDQDEPMNAPRRTKAEQREAATRALRRAGCGRCLRGKASPTPLLSSRSKYTRPCRCGRPRGLSSAGRR
jgi:hypothetical protein